MGAKKDIASLLGVAKNTALSADDLRQALDPAKADAEAKASDVAAAEAAYQTSLVDPDEAATEKADAIRTAARRSSDRAGALVEAIETRLADAMAREVETARQERYDAAKAASEKAAADLMRIYPKAATQIRDAFLALARADAAVQAANQDLPDGAIPLHGGERQLVLTPTKDREDISAEDVELWCIGGYRDRVLDDDQQRKVRNIKGDTGLFDWPGGSSNLDVGRRKFRRETYLPMITNQWVKSPLAVTVLPNLNTSAPDIWNANGCSGSYALAVAEDLVRRGEAYEKPAPIERQPQVDLVPVPDGR